MTDQPAEPEPTMAEREAWWQLFDSVASELGYADRLMPYDPRGRDDWLDCCVMPGPIHADDCPARGVPSAHED